MAWEPSEKPFMTVILTFKDVCVVLTADVIGCQYLYRRHDSLARLVATG
jgi:hypothetical protein